MIKTISSAMALSLILSSGLYANAQAPAEGSKLNHKITKEHIEKKKNRKHLGRKLHAHHKGIASLGLVRRTQVALETNKVNFSDEQRKKLTELLKQFPEVKALRKEANKAKKEARKAVEEGQEQSVVDSLIDTASQKNTLFAKKAVALKGAIKDIITKKQYDQIRAIRARMTK